MEFRVLGQLEVLGADGHPVPLGPPRQRALLAVLLIDVNRVVTLDQIVDRLWGEEPPSSAATLVHGYVSGLRRALEPDRPQRGPGQILVRHARGYSLSRGAEHGGARLAARPVLARSP